MFSIFVIAMAFATTAFAAPLEAKRSPGTPQPGFNPGVVFTNASCSLGNQALGYPPFGALFPTASELGKILGPVLTEALGMQTVNDIDAVAEDLCVSANQDQYDGPGLCANILQALADFVQHTGPAAADQYRCFLNAICVAQHAPQNEGTCQYLLAGVDCVANRIVGVGNVECEGQYGPGTY